MTDRTPMNDFHNRLRILGSIDGVELEEALGRPVPTAEWRAFCGNPFQWFIRACDADAVAVWAILDRRSA